MVERLCTKECKDKESLNFDTMNRCLPIIGCKKLCLITGLLFFSLASGQTGHYLFVQTENNQPFYMRIMGTNLSSNATGYLLIPKLTDGEYEIMIGFALSDKEHKFNFKVEGKDLGFSLKQELDNNWTLFNLVDFSLIKGQSVNIQPKEEKKQPEVIAPTETSKEAPKEQDLKSSGKEAVQNLKPVKVLPEIKKIYDRVSEDGIDMVFVVSGSPKNDTVILYVPALKPRGEARKTKELQRGIVKYTSTVNDKRDNLLVFTRPKLF